MKKQGNNDNSVRTSTRPIEGMRQLTSCQLKTLESRWKTTLDSFVAMASTEEGRAGLCKALYIEPEVLDDLLHDARDALGEKRYRELSQAKSGGPTGALWDEESASRIDDKPDK